MKLYNLLLEVIDLFANGLKAKKGLGNLQKYMQHACSGCNIKNYH